MTYDSEMGEPGLNREIWETRWEELDPLLQETPVEALPEVADLLGEMLHDLGFDQGEAAAEDTTEEIPVEFRQIRSVADDLRSAREVDVYDLGQAVADARELYGYLIENRRGFGGLAGGTS